MSFLTAQWRRLAFVNYQIDPKVLLPFVPYKTELDTWNEKTYVSLVGFLFKNVKIKGISIPYHKTFEEINLRFYVRYKDQGVWKRGVVFIKETVPKPAITFVANTLYKEHYETSKMRYSWEDTSETLKTTYALYKSKMWHQLSVTSKATSQPIILNTEEEFITEHYWGYSNASRKKTVEYQVTHPKWEVYPVVDYSIDFNFEIVHGPSFKVLNTIKPSTIFLAEGSEITIESKKVIH